MSRNKKLREAAMTDIADIWRFDLTIGSSKHPSRGACVMDAISWLEYGRLGDRPQVVCPIVAEMARILNDTLLFEPRQRLKLFIPRMIGTNHIEDLQPRLKYLTTQMGTIYLSPAGVPGVGRLTSSTLRPTFLRRFLNALMRIISAPMDAGYEFADQCPEPFGSPFRKIRLIATMDRCYRADPFIPGHATVEDPKEVLFGLLDGLLSIGKPGTMPDIMLAHQRAEDFARARMERVRS
jgi:hypothetical protein